MFGNEHDVCGVAYPRSTSGSKESSADADCLITIYPDQSGLKYEEEETEHETTVVRGENSRKDSAASRKNSFTIRAHPRTSRDDDYYDDEDDDRVVVVLLLR